MKRNLFSSRTVWTMICLLSISLVTLTTVYSSLMCYQIGFRANDDRLKQGDPNLCCKDNLLKDFNMKPGIHRDAGMIARLYNAPEFSVPPSSHEEINWAVEMDTNWKNTSKYQLLRDIYELKYTELKERKLMGHYPTQKSCKDEKRPAVPCNDTECDSVLSRDLDAGLSSLLTATDKIRKHFVNPLLPITTKLPRSHLTIVTAASANHFLESQAMIETLHKNIFTKFQNVSFYFYDMGLTSKQLEQLKRHCRCQVFAFPFHLMPNDINNIKCYTWKPLIVHAHLPKTNILIWADASVRFNTSKNDDLFDRVQGTGVLVSLSERYIRPVAHNTASQMFQYFSIKPCSVANFQEVEASFMAFHNQPFTKDIMVENWAACAVDPNCMCPNGTLSMHDCDGGLRKYAKCHRFDQSAMSLILLRLFREHYSSFFFDHSYYQVLRGVKSKYFNILDEASQKNTSKTDAKTKNRSAPSKKS